MSYTGATENYKLPLWLPSDHPDFLTDVNEENQKLDELLFTVSNTADYAKKQVDIINPILQSHTIELGELSTEVQRISEDNKELHTDYTDLNNRLETLYSQVQTIDSDYSDFKVMVTNNLETLNSTVEQAKSDIDSLQKFGKALELKYDTLPATASLVGEGVTCDNLSAFTVKSAYAGYVLNVAIDINGIANIQRTGGELGNLNFCIEVTAQLPYSLKADPIKMSKVGRANFVDLSGNIFSMTYLLQVATGESSSTIDIKFIPTPNVKYQFANQTIWLDFLFCESDELASARLGV